MPHTITCPTPDCGRQLNVPDALVGKKVKCPSCGNTFTAQIDEVPPPLNEEDEVPRQEEERPARRKASRDDDYEDEDDRPRRRRRRSHLKEHRGQLILILGILSFFVAPLILGPIAWIMGNADLQEIRAGRMDPEGESNTNTGRICGMIATIISGTCIVGICLFYIVFGVIVGVAGNLK